jgi:4-amino-4-deoxy-L-arabinose transferase-like glycosyltransferase
MPQTTDWCYAVTYSIGGEFAARLLNLFNLLVILGLLYSFIRQHCSHLAAIAICGLYATGPLVQVVTGSLVVENLLAALLFASCIVFCAHLEGRGARQFAAGWLFLGLALSCNAGTLAFLPGLIALALYSAWKRPAGWKGWAVAACGLLIGLYFYAFALLATRNPVFHYANEILLSELMPRDAIGGEFREPLTWRTLWDVTFNSSRFIEGTDGAAGFQYFLLLPAGLIVMIWRRQTAALRVVAVALSALFFGFSQMSYLWYSYPALLVLMVPMALWLEEQHRGSSFQMEPDLRFRESSGIRPQPCTGAQHGRNAEPDCARRARVFLPIRSHCRVRRHCIHNELAYLSPEPRTIEFAGSG